MFVQLGEHKFQGLKSPASWSETHETRYGKIPLINGKDVIQHTGEELSEINLSIRYSIDFCEPSTEIEALRQSMQAAKALPFITGKGSIVGKYVITSMDVSNETFSPEGQLILATLELNLLEAANAGQIETKGSALASVNPVVQTPIPAISGPANDITKDISNAKNKVNAMNEAVSDAKKGIKSYKSALRDVRAFADSAKKSYSSAKTKLEATKKIVNRASQLPTSLDDAIRYAENLAKLDNVSDINMLELNVKEMSNKANRVMVNAVPVVAFGASKEGGS